MRTSRYVLFLTLLFATALSLAPALPGQAESAVDPALWDRTVDRAIAYLKKTQGDDGGWASKQSPGITGIVVAGMLQTGKVKADDPSVDRGLKFIESLVNPTAGHIAGKDPRVQLQNYVTSVNVQALVAAGRDSYKPVIADAAKFLRKLQWDDEESKDRKSDFFGGAGYDSKSRPDLSNTQFFLDALVAAGLPKDDPAFKKAAVFVSRCQNLKGEWNDQPWADKINDGTFIYSAAAGGSTKTQDEPTKDGGLPGYGSMTYAGVKSLIYAGVTKDDPRIKKAFEWIKKNYTLETNPGMPGIRAGWGLYYYYHTLAKTLDLMGIDEIEDAQGKKHNWRAELVEALAKRQSADGSWLNEQDRWMEGNPQIVTGYALLALSYVQPKKK